MGGRSTYALWRRYPDTSTSGGRSPMPTSTGSRSGRTRVAAWALPRLGPAERRLEHREGLRAELVERPVAVPAQAEVDLRDGLGAGEVGDVDQQAEVDAVPLHERQPLQQGPAPGVLARQRLHDRRQVGEQRRDGRTGHELGDATTAMGAALHGPVVVALHEVDVGPGEQRAHQADDEVGAEREDVGVAPGDEVAARRPPRTCTAPRPCPRRDRARAGRRRRRAPGRRRRPRRAPCRRWSGRRAPGPRRRARSPRRGGAGAARRSGRRWRPRRGRGGTRTRRGRAAPSPRPVRRPRSRRGGRSGRWAAARRHSTGGPDSNP